MFIDLILFVACAEGWRVEILYPFSSSVPLLTLLYQELKSVSHKKWLSGQRDSNTTTKRLKKQHHETQKEVIRFRCKGLVLPDETMIILPDFEQNCLKSPLVYLRCYRNL